jgi:hypothetical protein
MVWRGVSLVSFSQDNHIALHAEGMCLPEPMFSLSFFFFGRQLVIGNRIILPKAGGERKGSNWVGLPILGQAC